jgi:Transposase IS116/IS110/IS902 family
VLFELQQAGCGQDANSEATSRPLLWKPTERILGVNATSIDGLDVITIQTVLAEVGPDLSAWKTEGHWAAWLNLAPKRDV